MSKPVYKALLDTMKNRGGEYSGMDIPEFYDMVAELFTPEEAEVNNAMPRGPFTAGDLAKSMGRDADEVEKILETMTDKGVCTGLRVGDATWYQSARFMPGILEFQFMPGRTTERDKKIARLIHAYKKAYDENTDFSKPSFPTNRVIIVDRMVTENNQVHTHDQVNAYIDKYDPIAVSTCFCRHAALLRDEDIHGMPNDVCMQFGLGAQFAIERLGARKVSKEEAREVMRRAEDAGLIHMSTNTADDINFICNCDRWHCVSVLHALARPKPGLAFNSGFMPVFDEDKCTMCEACIDRCPPGALRFDENDRHETDMDRCFGCAVCATGCPSDAVSMIRRTDIHEVPKDTQELKAALRAEKEAS